MRPQTRNFRLLRAQYGVIGYQNSAKRSCFKQAAAQRVVSTYRENGA